MKLTYNNTSNMGGLIELGEIKDIAARLIILSKKLKDLLIKRPENVNV